MKISVGLHLYPAKTYIDKTHPVVLEYLINGVRISARVLVEIRHTKL